MTFFISDTHFEHINVIKYCNRPFNTVEEMNEAMIEKWNKKVGPFDTVYIIGDFVWKKSRVPYYAERLNGKKILIIGNHDETWTRKKEHPNFACFDEVVDYKFDTVSEHPVTLCHYPMVEWRNSRKDDAPRLGYLIHGHIHNNYSEEYRYMLRHHNALNAGADVNNLEPVTFEELVENNLKFKLSVLSDEDKEYLLSSMKDNI